MTKEELKNIISKVYEICINNKNIKEDKEGYKDFLYSTKLEYSILLDDKTNIIKYGYRCFFTLFYKDFKIKFKYRNGRLEIYGLQELIENLDIKSNPYLKMKDFIKQNNNSKLEYWDIDWDEYHKIEENQKKLDTYLNIKENRNIHGYTYIANKGGEI